MKHFLKALSAIVFLLSLVELASGQSAALILGGLFQSGLLDKRENVKTRVEECTFTEDLHVWESGELFGCSQGREKTNRAQVLHLFRLPFELSFSPFCFTFLISVRQLVPAVLFVLVTLGRPVSA